MQDKLVFSNINTKASSKVNQSNPTSTNRQETNSKIRLPPNPNNNNPQTKFLQLPKFKATVPSNAVKSSSSSMRSLNFVMS